MNLQPGTLAWCRKLANKLQKTPNALRPPPKLIRQWLGPLAEAIDQERRLCAEDSKHGKSYRVLLREVPSSEKLALNTICMALTHCLKNPEARFDKLANAIGEAAQAQANFDRVEKEANAAWERYRRGKTSVHRKPDWPLVIMKHCGQDYAEFKRCWLERNGESQRSRQQFFAQGGAV